MTTNFTYETVTSEVMDQACLEELAMLIAQMIIRSVTKPEGENE